MKTIIVLASLFVAQMSLACLQQEAQFIGHVKNFQSEKNGQQVSCSYQIDYTMFNSSYVCPLYIGEVSYLRFVDETCQKQNGEQVSGILVKKDDVVFIE